MPKYAANLSVAPLQPQKQQAQTIAPNTETVEKAASKETGTWVDPFTPDGQECKFLSFKYNLLQLTKTIL